MQRGENQQSVSQRNVDEQPQFQRELQCAVIIESVFLADKRGKFFNFFALNVIGKTAQVFEFGEQRAGRTTRFREVQPEIFRAGEKWREPLAHKIPR